VLNGWLSSWIPGSRTYPSSDVPVPNNSYFMAMPVLWTRHIFRVIALLGILAIGCNSPTLTDNSTPSEIWPFAIGNRWAGRVTSYNEVGGIDSTWFRTYSITGTIDLFDGQWYQSNPDSYYRNTSNGCYHRIDGRNEFLLKYPGNLGDTCNSQRYVRITSTGQIVDTVYGQTTITAVDTMVTVPRGTFTCMEYSMAVPQLPGSSSAIASTFHYFYAPGVGPVKEIYSGYDSTQLILVNTWELVDYTLH
jgi:hypothetical protein